MNIILEMTLEAYMVKKGFNNSETDTIRKHLYHAELLRDKAKNFYNNEEKRNRLCEAANIFEKLYYKES